MIHSIDDLSLSGKRVLVRVDFNVPQDESGAITDDIRIRESLPTIQKIIHSGGKAILMSHLGRPKGKVNVKYSLKPAATRLAELLGKPVTMAPDCIGDEVGKIITLMENGDVTLLENVRFYAQEEENEEEFSRKLAALGDVYVNDAFGSAHRAHASTHGVTKFINSRAAGYLMQKELKYLGDAVANPKRPFTAILGGSKISGKIDVITSLLDKCDTIIVGGGMIFTFYKAMGKEIGDSLVEEDKIALAEETLAKAKAKNVKLLLPTDAVVADAFSNDAVRKTVSVDNIEKGWRGLDIGPDTIKLFSDVILSSQTVVWNGPMGVFEMSNFADGTQAVAQSLADASAKGAITIVGGGDSAAAIEQFGFAKAVSHVSTGGGASLEFLEGKELPGVAALNV
ncbi:MAG: phosphoglycerate kinase [Candidatus Kapaibacterium sp.]|nr:MAG: phosphoglycerate kinase [Candidatus Kapabacteria bacterium]